MNVVAICAPVLLGLFIANSVGAAQQDSPQRQPTPPDLAAAPTYVVDEDGDGLDDALEAGQHSSPERVDTDSDGWNDAEELARGSLATVNCSQPSEAPASVGARAYLRGGRLHAAFAVYLRSGSLNGVKLNIGIYACHTMFPLQLANYSRYMTITTVPTNNPGELLVVTDVVLPIAPLLRTGAMSIYGTLQLGENLTSAASINLVLNDGIPTELIPPSQMSPGAEQQLGPGILHRPLGGSTPPVSWSAGEICFQRMESVGSHGAVVTQEVTSATCVDGWDAYCDGGNCSSSVGSTVDLVDPSALIGG